MQNIDWKWFKNWAIQAFDSRKFGKRKKKDFDMRKFLKLGDVILELRVRKLRNFT